MNGATHKVKPGYADGPFAEYVKHEDGKYYSFNDLSGNWWLDNNIREHLSVYDEIDDLTETPEEKEIFDNWPAERRIDIIATNGNTGEHYLNKHK